MVVESYRTEYGNVLADSLTPGQLSSSNLFDVSGQVAVVTGGGTGIGLITALGLAENGAKVYITGRRADVVNAAAEKYSPKKGTGSIVPVVGDMSSKEGVDALRAVLVKNEKYVNVLINNHAIQVIGLKFHETDGTAEGISAAVDAVESFEKWTEMYRINCASYFFTTMALLPLLAKAEVGGKKQPGSVINVSSISGLCNDSQGGQFNYNASKAAVNHLSSMMAAEFAERELGVRVNTICPGHFPSGINTTNLDESPETKYQFARKEMEIPFGRPGVAPEYVRLVLSIATNTYQTGTLIPIDGGYMTKH
ncbi:hypothetical protein M231_06433 [Tremella mesenterica]|uniref:Short-chain dehydrogenase n=1 Tax=Tremella mesenterica TaxID=5217 RepID=A0A4Q1BDJ2_TREME|nr:hypothetical protein M231_06433 [Tremella mesenterica]